ncbi:MAG: hypothetical protein E6K63_15160 [Nitrospirae bacterium]|nr:MAG: hypothetical protein E6K63_15160 [Nitrospirota bacterium]
MADPTDYYTPARVVLLTGAGFSKNFGGLLGSEMWSLILNQPEITASDKLRACLLENLNYEMVYDTVINSENYTTEEKADFTAALEKAYRALDDAVRFEDVRQRGQKAMMLRSFLNRFGGSGRGRAFFFTLNQDLLVERFYSNQEGLMQIPGLGHPEWFTHFETPLTPEHEITLLDQTRVDTWRSRFWARGGGIQHFVYVKLHGSYGWRATDGSRAMVIGTAKARIIDKEPLLRWYLDLFKAVVERPGQLLVVTGYGFMDDHINNVIADAIRDAGLRVHVILPKAYPWRCAGAQRG